MGEIWYSGEIFGDQGSGKDFQLIHIEIFFSGLNISIDPHSLLRQLILLEHRSIRFIGEDQVVKDLDAQQFTCFHQPCGDHQVIKRWSENAAGVVVGYDDRCRPLSQWVRKDLPLLVARNAITTYI
jgi:hypothetical protein